MSKFNEKFKKNFDESSDIGYIRVADAKYPKRLHNLQRWFTILPARMKITKCSKLVYNVYDKNNYVAHIRTLKQTLNHGKSWINIKKSERSNSI